MNFVSHPDHGQGVQMVFYLCEQLTAYFCLNYCRYIFCGVCKIVMYTPIDSSREPVINSMWGLGVQKKRSFQTLLRSSLASSLSRPRRQFFRTS